MDPALPSVSLLRKSLEARAPTPNPSLRRGGHSRQAGVLVPLIWTGGGEVVLTERPRTMRQHAGEVCFPGGRPLASDADLCQTALREAQEEIGVESVSVLGQLGSVSVYGSEYCLEPFVGVVEAPEIRPDAGEVRRVLMLPLRQTLEADCILGLPWSDRESGETDWLVPTFAIEDATVFGGTAVVLYELLAHVATLFGTLLPPLRPAPYTWADVFRMAKGGGT